MDSPCGSLKRKPAPVDLEFCQGVKGKFEGSEEFFTPKECSEVSPRTDCSAGVCGKEIVSSTSTEFFSDLSKTQEIEEGIENNTAKFEEDKEKGFEVELGAEKNMGKDEITEIDKKVFTEGEKEKEEVDNEKIKSEVENEEGNIIEKLGNSELNTLRSQDKFVGEAESGDLSENAVTADKNIEISG